LLLWGLWLAVHFLVFSYQQGTMHPYYTTTMGPAIGALVGGGGAVVWRRLHEQHAAGRAAGGRWAWLVLPVVVGVTALWSITLLNRTAFATWLVPIIAIAAIVAIVALIAARTQPMHRARLGAVGLAALLLAGLAGPAAFAASAADSTVNGTNPLAGPANGSLGGPRGGGGAGGFRGGFGRGGEGFAQGFPGGTGAQPPQGGFAGAPGGQASGGGAPFLSGQSGQGGPRGLGDQPSAGAPGGLGGGGFGPGGGSVSSALLSYLEKNQGSATWLVAVANSNAAASLELQSGRAVISMFGFTGSDSAMTVAKLRQLVASGQLKYVMLGGGGGPGRLGGGDSGSSQVDTWVQQNCTAVAASAYGGTSTTSTSATSELYACTSSTSS
jgi:hypothetical protein